MEFKIEPVVPADAEEVTDVFLASFSDDFSRRLFPCTEEVRAWWIQKFAADAEQAHSQHTVSFMKMVGTVGSDQRPVIAAFALWELPKKAPVGEGTEDEHVTWPVGSDSELCDLFFEGIHKERKSAVKGQPHYYLSMLGTHPSFGRRGLSGRLLKWGLDRADEEKMEVFISASPPGRGLVYYPGAWNSQVVMDKYKFPTHPTPSPGATVQGPTYRFTLLTDRLIRYEWAEHGQFEDRASTFAINQHFHMSYTKEKFSPESLGFQFNGKSMKYGTPWRFGTPVEFNLGGTARTLDQVNGRCDMGQGVLSKAGFAVIDDSKSMLFDGNGWVAERLPGERFDGYLFCYGRDYKAAIKAFYALSGKQPILPRYVFGNWWSRYYAYHQDEYVRLMDAFNQHRIPLSVAVVDMDWHYVSDDRVPHAGWTGYTWNPSLFPDPGRFRRELNERSLKITLNDHPHSGVYPYEDAYEEMSQFLGRDPDKKNPIMFDPANPKFMEAYLGILHRRLERQACDFWWIDWQQGPYSKIPGLDPLWLLNHFQYLDSGLDGKTALVFSRFAGPGSHRYPVGFSGDTIVSWASLAFQPEFTATASNIGYGWWSHDIGGHIFGGRDDELFARWVQLGVFSPIMRLHSTTSHWMSKEPWLYGQECDSVVSTYMRFRHRLIPYLYTHNVISSVEDEPLVQPLYWRYPYHKEAYEFPNQYFFGQKLMVAPIVQPRDPRTHLASVQAWLPPDKRYVDIFTGTVYDGDRELTFFRPLEGYPVLAHEGSIITLDDDCTGVQNGCFNPDVMQVLVVVGADGQACTVEDPRDSKSQKRDQAVDPEVRQYQLKYSQSEGRLTAAGVNGHWRFLFLTLTSIPPDLKVYIDGTDRTEDSTFSIQEFPQTPGLLVSCPGDYSVQYSIDIELGPNPQLDVRDHGPYLERLIMQYQTDFAVKD
ncbi:hypothetical protein AOCH_004754, partial [Aspergillus ochraceoroseus]